jgi:hypothetical protein
VLVLSAAVFVSRNRLGCCSWSNRRSTIHEPFDLDFDFDFDFEYEYEYEYEKRRMWQSLMNSHQQSWWFTNINYP